MVVGVTVTKMIMMFKYKTQIIKVHYQSHQIIDHNLDNQLLVKNSEVNFRFIDDLFLKQKLHNRKRIAWN